MRRETRMRLFGNPHDHPVNCRRLECGGVQIASLFWQILQSRLRVLGATTFVRSAIVRLAGLALSHFLIGQPMDSNEEVQMQHAYWNDWYFGGGWFLWFGIMLLLFSSLGNWGYTYRAHQKYGKGQHKAPFEILDSRYAKGEITREEYRRMKSEIAAAPLANKDSASSG